QKIYLMVVQDGYHSAEIYKKLGDTYYYNSDYISAVKWYEKLIHSYPDDVELDYYYRTAQSLKSADRQEDSKQMMDKYLELGGELPITQTFESDPEYLKKLGIQPSKFVVEPVEINSKYSDFGSAYYLDKFVFSASTKDLSNFKTHNWNNLPYLDLYMADMDEEGILSNPQKLEGEINSDYHESTPAFTKDGRTVYFTRNNFLQGKVGAAKDRTIKLKLYKATKGAGNTWVNVTELPFNNDEYSVSHPTLSKDEKRLYFASDMPGTFGRSDLWYVDIMENNVYGEPVNLGAKINTRGKETFPFISENNNLYFASNRRGGKGGLDVYIATLDSLGAVNDISNFGPPVNTRQDDFGFIIQESKKIGYFTSNAGGGRGSIDDEIYRFKEVCVMTIRGKVVDMDTKELIPGATVALMDANNKLLETVEVGEDASYSFTVECDSAYMLRGTKDEYYPQEKIAETPEYGGVVEIDLELKLKDPCPPDDLGCRLSLQPIYFDYDKANIRPDAEIELAKILSALKAYPQLVIHIESHTDSRGNDRYNEKLSGKRAKSTLDWLVTKGIEGTRLSSKGYGETQLQNRCSNDVECTEVEHQLNRRSMFMIQN
ncbi:MAG: OmpA family protein, partial [Bacteroidota bacterium]